MNLIWEFNIADLNGSEYYFVLDSEKRKFTEIVKNFISVGKAVGEHWISPLILKKEEKYKYDFFHIRGSEDIFEMMKNSDDDDLTEDAICITQRVYDELYPILKNEVEFLVMKSDDGIYYVMNIINCIDCLNKELSVYNMAPNGLIIDYEDLVLRTEKMDAPHIFRIPQLPYSVFLTDDLKEIIEDYEELSFSEDELVFDGTTIIG